MGIGSLLSFLTTISKVVLAILLRFKERGLRKGGRDAERAETTEDALRDTETSHAAATAVKPSGVRNDPDNLG